MGNVRERDAPGADHRRGPAIVQRGQRIERLDARDEGIVDAERTDATRPAVDDAVADRDRHAAELRPGRLHDAGGGARIVAAAGPRDLGGGERRSARNQARLQRARAGVEDEDRIGQVGHAQSRIAGSSSPWARV